MKTLKHLIIISVGVLALLACQHNLSHQFRQHLGSHEISTIPDTTQQTFLKIYLANGDLAVLDSWLVEDDKIVRGSGTMYDYNRSISSTGQLSIDIDDILIAETNDLAAIQSKDKGRLTALTILSGVTVAGAIYCAINPKACFGSCPTFYIDAADPVMAARAEGFSSSISPSLKALDRDDIAYQTQDPSFCLTVKNEALETHVIDELFLETVKISDGQMASQTMEGDVYAYSELMTPSSALVDDRCAVAELQSGDGYEYFSLADSNDLFHQEELILQFPHHTKKLGLVIEFRQSLMTTFVLYSGLSFMGTNVGEYFAEIEKGGRSRRMMESVFDRFSQLDIEVWDLQRERWTPLESISETGPIASNELMIPIPPQLSEQGQLSVKVKMSKGAWRIDRIALAQEPLKMEVQKIHPSHLAVIQGSCGQVQDVTAEDDEVLISLPGDEYSLEYHLPTCSDGETNRLFLGSRGYYLEWMRTDWIQDQDEPRLKRLLMQNKKEWKIMAREYKAYEDQMEWAFWNTTYSQLEMIEL